jgi:hypothetical protein
MPLWFCCMLIIAICDDCMCHRRLLLQHAPWIACFWTKRPHMFPNFWALLHSAHNCFLHLSQSFIWKCGSYTGKVFYCTLANYINNRHPAKVVTLYMHWDSKKILWETYRYTVMNITWLLDLEQCVPNGIHLHLSCSSAIT